MGVFDAIELYICCIVLIKKGFLNLSLIVVLMVINHTDVGSHRSSLNKWVTFPNISIALELLLLLFLFLKDLKVFLIIHE